MFECECEYECESRLIHVPIGVNVNVIKLTNNFNVPSQMMEPTTRRCGQIGRARVSHAGVRGFEPMVESNQWLIKLILVLSIDTPVRSIDTPSQVLSIIRIWQGWVA